MFPGETIMSGANGGEFGTRGYSELKVMQSAAGFYLGTEYQGMPGSRESSYFRSEEEAEAALTTWPDGACVGLRL